MFSMPGTAGKWIRGAMSTSNMFLVNMFSSCWYWESYDLLQSVLFSSPNQHLLFPRALLFNIILPVSGIQISVSSLALTPKPKVPHFRNQKLFCVLWVLILIFKSNFRSLIFLVSFWDITLSSHQFFLCLIIKAYFLITGDQKFWCSKCFQVCLSLSLSQCKSSA